MAKNWRTSSLVLEDGSTHVMMNATCITAETD